MFPFQVVGSQARILYSDHDGRIAIAVAFNNAVADGRLKVSFSVWLTSEYNGYLGSEKHNGI